MLSTAVDFLCLISLIFTLIDSIIYRSQVLVFEMEMPAHYPNNTAKQAAIVGFWIDKCNATLIRIMNFYRLSTPRYGVHGFFGYAPTQEVFQYCRGFLLGMAICVGYETNPRIGPQTFQQMFEFFESMNTSLCLMESNLGDKVRPPSKEYYLKLLDELKELKAQIKKDKENATDGKSGEIISPPSISPNSGAINPITPTDGSSAGVTVISPDIKSTESVIMSKLGEFTKIAAGADTVLKNIASILRALDSRIPNRRVMPTRRDDSSGFDQIAELRAKYKDLYSVGQNADFIAAHFAFINSNITSENFDSLFEDMLHLEPSLRPYSKRVAACYSKRYVVGNEEAFQSFLNNTIHPVLLTIVTKHILMRKQGAQSGGRHKQGPMDSHDFTLAQNTTKLPMDPVSIRVRELEAEIARNELFASTTSGKSALTEGNEERKILADESSANRNICVPLNTVTGDGFLLSNPVTFEVGQITCGQNNDSPTKEDNVISTDGNQLDAENDSINAVVGNKEIPHDVAIDNTIQHTSDIKDVVGGNSFSVTEASLKHNIKLEPELQDNEGFVDGEPIQNISISDDVEGEIVASGDKPLDLFTIKTLPSHLNFSGDGQEDDSSILFGFLPSSLYGGPDTKWHDIADYVFKQKETDIDWSLVQTALVDDLAFVAKAKSDLDDDEAGWIKLLNSGKPLGEIDILKLILFYAACEKIVENNFEKEISDAIKTSNQMETSDDKDVDFMKCKMEENEISRAQNDPPSTNDDEILELNAFNGSGISGSNTSNDVINKCDDKEANSDISIDVSLNDQYFLHNYKAVPNLKENVYFGFLKPESFHGIESKWNDIWEAISLNDDYFGLHAEAVVGALKDDLSFSRKLPESDREDILALIIKCENDELINNEDIEDLVLFNARNENIINVGTTGSLEQSKGQNVVDTPSAKEENFQLESMSDSKSDLFSRYGESFTVREIVEKPVNLHPNARVLGTGTFQMKITDTRGTLLFSMDMANLIMSSGPFVPNMWQYGTLPGGLKLTVKVSLTPLCGIALVCGYLEEGGVWEDDGPLPVLALFKSPHRVWNPACESVVEFSFPLAACCNHFHPTVEGSRAGKIYLATATNWYSAPSSSLGGTWSITYDPTVISSVIDRPLSMKRLSIQRHLSVLSFPAGELRSIRKMEFAPGKPFIGTTGVGVSYWESLLALHQYWKADVYLEFVRASSPMISGSFAVTVLPGMRRYKSAVEELQYLPRVEFSIPRDQSKCVVCLPKHLFDPVAICDRYPAIPPTDGRVSHTLAVWCLDAVTSPNNDTYVILANLVGLENLETIGWSYGHALLAHRAIKNRPENAYRLDANIGSLTVAADDQKHDPDSELKMLTYFGGLVEKSNGQNFDEGVLFHKLAHWDVDNENKSQQTGAGRAAICFEIPCPKFKAMGVTKDEVILVHSPIVNLLHSATWCKGKLYFKIVWQSRSDIKNADFSGVIRIVGSWNGTASLPFVDHASGLRSGTFQTHYDVVGYNGGFHENVKSCLLTNQSPILTIELQNAKMFSAVTIYVGIGNDFLTAGAGRVTWANTDKPIGANEIYMEDDYLQVEPIVTSNVKTGEKSKGQNDPPVGTEKKQPDKSCTYKDPANCPNHKTGKFTEVEVFVPKLLRGKVIQPRVLSSTLAGGTLSCISKGIQQECGSNSEGAALIGAATNLLGRIGFLSKENGDKVKVEEENIDNTISGKEEIERSQGQTLDSPNIVNSMVGVPAGMAVGAISGLRDGAKFGAKEGLTGVVASNPITSFMRQTVRDGVTSFVDTSNSFLVWHLDMSFHMIGFTKEECERFYTCLESVGKKMEIRSCGFSAPRVPQSITTVVRNLGDRGYLVSCGHQPQAKNIENYLLNVFDVFLPKPSQLNVPLPSVNFQYQGNNGMYNQELQGVPNQYSYSNFSNGQSQPFGNNCKIVQGEGQTAVYQCGDIWFAWFNGFPCFMQGFMEQEVGAFMRILMEVSGQHGVKQNDKNAFSSVPVPATGVYRQYQGRILLVFGMHSPESKGVTDLVLAESLAKFN
uniref:RNA2 polyprotein n=1 Tax=Camphor tree fabavirus TaxID=3115796 RepID=A0AAT9JHD4_9SECO